MDYLSFGLWYKHSRRGGQNSSGVSGFETDLVKVEPMGEVFIWPEFVVYADGILPNFKDSTGHPFVPISKFNLNFVTNLHGAPPNNGSRSRNRTE